MKALKRSETDEGSSGSGSTFFVRFDFEVVGRGGGGGTEEGRLTSNGELGDRGSGGGIESFL